MAKKSRNREDQLGLGELCQIVDEPRLRLMEAEALLRCLRAAMEVELSPGPGGSYSMTLVLESASRLVAQVINDLDVVELVKVRPVPV